MPVTVSSALLSKLKKAKAVPKAEEEICNFCGKPIPEEHRHLVDLKTRQFMCACEICSIVQSVSGNYTTVPRRYQYLQDFNMSDELWSEFLIPVNMAFFVFNTEQNGIVAYYPAPTGATESKLKMEAWGKLKQLNPVLDTITNDVEALLVNRLDAAGEYFIVPIDRCYELIGIIRSNWKGLFGGKDVQDAARQFFKTLKNKTSDAGIKL